VPSFERPDGCRLYFEEHGPKNGRVLVLLEGMGGDIPGWRRNIPRLAERRRVVALDFRGNGRSDAPDEPMSMATLVDDTMGLLDHLGVDRAHLYGMSMGGMVAIESALTRPGRVRSLVLAATHAGPARASAPARRRSVPKDRPYLALYSRRFAAEHPDHVAEDILVGSQQPQPASAGRRQWEAVQAWDAWDRLGDIRVPALVLHGTEDDLVDVANARRLAAAIPGAELVLLEGAGHLYHSEQPDEADRAVNEFLARVDAGS
jgi:pimeloyl-ACP methyl ester carboxylesterase